MGPAGDIDRYDRDFPPEWDAIPSRPDGDRDYGSELYRKAKEVRTIHRMSGEGRRTKSREVGTTGWSGDEIQEDPDYRSEVWDHRRSSGRGGRSGDRSVARKAESSLSRTSRNRSPSLERGVRFEERYRGSGCSYRGLDRYGYEMGDSDGNETPRIERRDYLSPAPARRGRSALTRRRISQSRMRGSGGESSDEDAPSWSQRGHRGSDASGGEDSGYGGR
jgi:hypothetical protein